MTTDLPFLSCHQFLTRPVNGVIKNFVPPDPKDPKNQCAAPIRDIVGIKHSSVRDLCFETFWDTVYKSLDYNYDHDVAGCLCCGGKRVNISKRSFVLAICGDLRELSSEGRSWPG